MSIFQMGVFLNVDSIIVRADFQKNEHVGADAHKSVNVVFLYPHKSVIAH